jgi:hypothetical protein
MSKKIITGVNYRKFCELLWIFINNNSVITLTVRIPLIRFGFLGVGGGEGPSFMRTDPNTGRSSIQI